MKRILLIGTGGTIASDITPDGLSPDLTAEKLLAFIPSTARYCTVECLELFSLDSTNIHPEHWVAIADTVAKQYNDYDGFVITHGTDTMAYTASALSYLLQNCKKPVIITGAQKPIWFDGTDSKRNLTDAMLYACHGSGGVQIVFNGKVILGTRARKTYSKSFQAFSSVNYPILAVIQDEKLLQYIRLPAEGEPLFSHALNTSVGLLKLAPGIDSSVVAYMLDRYDGLVIEGFGVGGLPEYSDFYEVISQASAKGKIIVMTTQVPNEGSDLSVYHVGGRLKSTVKLLEAYDMTTESAYTKLMWILAKTKSFDEVKTLFYKPVAADNLHPIDYTGKEK